MSHIYLIGFMGTGKSTVGRALAKSLGRTLLDTDEMIISRDGRDIPTIFDEDGEAGFRKLEKEVISDIAAMDEECIISCGGGVVLSKENVTAMRSSGRVVWLSASASEILRRVEADENRPLLKGKKTIDDITLMMEKRHDAYAKAADDIIDTEGLLPVEIAEKIMETPTGRKTG